jgi:hypothetical protein
MFGAFRNPVPSVAPIHQPLNANSRVQEWMGNERLCSPSRERNSDDQIDVPKGSYFATTRGANFFCLLVAAALGRRASPAEGRTGCTGTVASDPFANSTFLLPVIPGLANRSLGEGGLSG